MTVSQSGEDRISRRLLLGAFGDPGHAFPMIALGSALAARGHDVTLQTWTRWREPVEAAGHDASPRRPSTTSSRRASGRCGPTRRWSTRRARRGRWSPRCGPDAVVADILTLAPALAGELEGVPVGTLIPHGHPAGAPGFPPYSLGRATAADAGRAADVGAACAARRPGARARARRAERDARRGSACRRWTRVHGGISRALCLVATFPQLEYPRGWDVGDARRRAAALGAAVRGRRAAARRRAAGAGRAVDVAGSGAHAGARGAGGAGGPAGAGARREPRRRVDRPLRVPANARVVEWVSYGAHDAAVRRRRVPRRARDAGARARQRGGRGRLPGGGRHERERRAGRLGRGRRAAAAEAARAAARCGWRCSARWTSPGCASGPASWRAGTRAPTRRGRAAELVEQFAAAPVPAS